MSIDALIAARESSYCGVGSWRTPAIYNTVEELLDLSEAGYLIGPDDRTIAVQNSVLTQTTPTTAQLDPGKRLPATGPPTKWTASSEPTGATSTSPESELDFLWKPPGWTVRDGITQTSTLWTFLARGTSP